MSKSLYREYFANVRKFVIMKPFLKEAGIAQSNFTYFMKDDAYNHLVSLDKLEKLESCLKNGLYEIIG